MPDDAARPPSAVARTGADDGNPGWLSPGWLTFTVALLLALWIVPGLEVAPATKERLAYVLAFLLGGAVGLTELLARYRDNPVSVMITKPAAVYVAVNACSSILAFWLIYTGRLPLEAQLFAEKHKALNALFLAVFGAMAFFRTSVFNLRVKDSTISIGPAAALQILLRLSDREVDRLRAIARAGQVKRIMEGVIYERARNALPFFAQNVLQNLGPEERNDLDQALAQLAAEDLSDEAKAYNLGLLMMNVLGERALERAVQGLGERIRGPAPEEERSPIFTQATNLDFDDLRSILSACAALDREQRDGAVTQRLRPILADRGHEQWREMGVAREADQVVIALAMLRSAYGAETVAQAIGAIIAGRSRPLDAASGAQANPTFRAATALEFANLSVILAVAATMVATPPDEAQLGALRQRLSDPAHPDWTAEGVLSERDKVVLGLALIRRLLGPEATATAVGVVLAGRGTDDAAGNTPAGGK